ncbi:hypothetical protein [Halomarina rubra]|uniref:HNH endonuclease n=1 Tax=Halomarina rubra TaxID=2071873 RepID=A0ABD6AT07_9EURY|nr:hypothetical protein [Halomarina rubra]
MSDYRAALHCKARHRAREVFWGVHDRDAYRCPSCGGRGPFEVHHRNGDWLDNRRQNLIGVCHACHRRAHRERNTDARLAEWKSELAGLQEGA